MGTSFVSLSGTSYPGEIGFWMRDNALELWLRLLALHIPEPTTNHDVTYQIRNQWLLASRGYFGGHVPHALDEANSTPAGREIVLAAINSLMTALRNAPASLSDSTLALMGMTNCVRGDFETRRLMEIGHAFQDLLAGKLTCTIESTDFMPGT